MIWVFTQVTFAIFSVVKKALLIFSAVQIAVSRLKITIELKITVNFQRSLKRNFVVPQTSEHESPACNHKCQAFAGALVEGLAGREQTSCGQSISQRQSQICVLEFVIYYWNSSNLLELHTISCHLAHSSCLLRALTR